MNAEIIRQIDAKANLSDILYNQNKKKLSFEKEDEELCDVEPWGNVGDVALKQNPRPHRALKSGRNALLFDPGGVIEGAGKLDRVVAEEGKNSKPQ